MIRTLRTLGISAHTSPHTGVWVGSNKICALGVSILTSFDVVELNSSFDIVHLKNVPINKNMTRISILIKSRLNLVIYSHLLF